MAAIKNRGIFLILLILCLSSAMGYELKNTLSFELNHIIQQYSVIDYDTVYSVSEARSVYYTFYNSRTAQGIFNVSNLFSVGTKMIKDDIYGRIDREIGKLTFGTRISVSSALYTEDKQGYYDYILINLEPGIKARWNKASVELALSIAGKSSENSNYNFFEYKPKLIGIYGRFSSTRLRFSITGARRVYRGELYSSYYRVNPELSLEVPVGELSNLSLSVGYDRQNVDNTSLSRNNSTPYIRLDLSLDIGKSFSILANSSFEQKKYDEQDFIRYNYSTLNSSLGLRYDGINWNISFLPLYNYFYGDTFYFAEPYYELGIRANASITKRKKFYLDSTIELGKREYFNQTEFSFSTPYTYTNLMLILKVWIKEFISLNLFCNYTPEWHKNPSDNFVLTYITTSIKYEF